MRLRRCGVVLVILTILVLSAQAAQRGEATPPTEPDGLVGAWRLNLAKSQDRPGPALTSETRTYVRAGGEVQGVIARTFADGRRERVEYTASFDREYPVLGTDDYDHVVLKRIDRFTSEAVLSHAGRVFGTARRVISNDGKSMTIIFKRDSESGPSVYNVAYYDRLPDAQ